ncbi:MAG: tetratricopeptide repeat protein [Verrucomicrobiota bacterium]
MSCPPNELTVPPPDRHYLDATVGWLMLGNYPEAWGEFQQIAPGFRQHPEVLETEWRLLAAEKRWEDSLRVAGQLIQLYPADVSGWIDRSFALHELKRTRDAWEHLLPVVDRFPNEPVIPYNLACYACQMGDFAVARRWLKRAFELEKQMESKVFRGGQALDDPDLQPLWNEIPDLLE